MITLIIILICVSIYFVVVMTPGIIATRTEYVVHRKHTRSACNPDVFCSEDYAGYFDAPDGSIVERIPQREDRR